MHAGFIGQIVVFSFLMPEFWVPFEDEFFISFLTALWKPRRI